MAVLINGITLQPQPAATEWERMVTGLKLNGTDETGAYDILRISAPAIKSQVFNWQQFENQVLTSVTVPPPGSGPEDAVTTYSSGAAARRIVSYQSPEDRTVRGVMMEIWVITG